MPFNFNVTPPARLQLPVITSENLYSKVVTFTFTHYDGDIFQPEGPVVELNDLDCPYNAIYAFHEYTIVTYRTGRFQLLNDHFYNIMTSGRGSLRMATRFNLHRIIHLKREPEDVDMDEILVKCWRRYIEALRREEPRRMIDFVISLLMPTVSVTIWAHGARECKPIRYLDVGGANDESDASWITIDGEDWSTDKETDSDEESESSDTEDLKTSEDETMSGLTTVDGYDYSSVDELFHAKGEEGISHRVYASVSHGIPQPPESSEVIGDAVDDMTPSNIQETASGDTLEAPPPGDSKDTEKLLIKCSSPRGFIHYRRKYSPNA
ncbi:hypothetical protein ABW19_dt0210451 [Dactylella cylindrospora]|nr:hypothetical protein ABW19_dt0210451 [Dactylella cylindrospora]